MGDRKPHNVTESQSTVFKEAARALGCDESEERFNEALGKIARVKPKTDAPEKIEEREKQSLKNER